MTERLHLIAAEAADVPILSSLLQDAAVRVADIGYDVKARRFALVGNRYRWEAKDKSRVRCALAVGSVLRLQRKDWPLDPGAILNLLAVRLDGDTLTLDFAGGPSLRVDIEAVDVLLDDLTGPWGTRRRPDHADG